MGSPEMVGSGGGVTTPPLDDAHPNEDNVNHNVSKRVLVMTVSLSPRSEEEKPDGC